MIHILSKILFFLFFLCLSINTISTQNICGIDVEKYYYYPSNKRLYVRVQLCRENISVPQLYFDWGDGQIDTIPVAGSYSDGIDYKIDNYFGLHHYDPALNDYVELRILGETVMDDFVNVDYSMGTSFLWSDSLFVYTEENMPLIGAPTNLGPRANSLGVSRYIGGSYR